MKNVLFYCVLALFPLQANAADESSRAFGKYTVHYSTFNSLFISADIAKLHGLVRAKDQTLINISVQETETGKSVVADVAATAKNLMQQVKSITFKKIEEPGAVYYIGSLRHSNREVFHLDFSVGVEGEVSPMTFKLTKKLYVEL